MEENSCRTPAILIAVTAPPCKEDNNTRRKAFPIVVANPRSNGSTTMVALRPGMICSSAHLSGLINSCQFFCIIIRDSPFVKKCYPGRVAVPGVKD